MDEKTLNLFLFEINRIESKVLDELVDRDLREIQRDELELLVKILQQLKTEESISDLSWEKSTLFYSISLLHYNIRFYPTLLGLRSSLSMIMNAISEKGILTPSQQKEIENVTIDLLINEINILFNLVSGE